MAGESHRIVFQSSVFTGRANTVGSIDAAPNAVASRGYVHPIDVGQTRVFVTAAGLAEWNRLREDAGLDFSVMRDPSAWSAFLLGDLHKELPATIGKKE